MSDWLEKRGREKTKYVMARKGDKGRYAPWNVECLTNTENCQARKTNGVAAKGEKCASHKLTDNQAKEIFLAKGTLGEIAHSYSVSITAIRLVKIGKTWKHVTKGVRFGKTALADPVPVWNWPQPYSKQKALIPNLLKNTA